MLYEVTVEGQYVLAGRSGEINYYEEKFKLGEGRPDFARVIIQNSGILEKKLMQLKNFKRWQTCQVTGVKELEQHPKKADVELEQLLLLATSMGCIPPDYKNLGSDKMKKLKLEEAIKRHKERVERVAKKDDTNKEKLEEGYV